MKEIDIDSLEARLDDYKSDLEDELREFMSIPDSFCGLTLSIGFGVDGKISLFFQLGFDEPNTLAHVDVTEVANELSETSVPLSLDTALSEFELRLADVNLSISSHVVD
jgi:hypothetical protein